MRRPITTGQPDRDAGREDHHEDHEPQAAPGRGVDRRRRHSDAEHPAAQGRGHIGGVGSPAFERHAAIQALRRALHRFTPAGDRLAPWRKRRQTGDQAPIAVGDADDPTVREALRAQQIDESIGSQHRGQNVFHPAVLGDRHAQRNRPVAAVKFLRQAADHRSAGGDRFIEALAIHHVGAVASRRVRAAHDAAAVERGEREVAPIGMRAHHAPRLGMERGEVAGFQVARSGERAQRGERAAQLGVNRAHHRDDAIAGGVAHVVAILPHDEQRHHGGEDHDRGRGRNGKEQQVRAQAHGARRSYRRPMFQTRRRAPLSTPKSQRKSTAATTTVAAPSAMPAMAFQSGPG